MKKLLMLAVVALAACGCSDDKKESSNENSNSMDISKNFISFSPAVTMDAGQFDNAEIVRAIKNTNDAILVSSKAQKLTRYTFDENKGISLVKVSDSIIAEPASDDDEITSGNLYDKDVFIATHTILRKTGDKITSCEGELIAVSIKDDDFGTVLKTVEVGPMPDYVAVSPDKKWAISADERDSAVDAWGKCPVTDAVPSVTIVDLSKGVTEMKAVARIKFPSKSEYGPREPEGVAIASDNDTVAVSLQDSNEMAIFRISDVVNKKPDPSTGLIEMSENDVKIVMLPVSEEGLYTWPDGVVSIKVGGEDYFVLAGEWNDMIVTADTNGDIVSKVQIRKTEVPTNYPCSSEADSPRYSPDSLTTYKLDGHTYVAASLRYAGAVIAIDFDDPKNPKFAGIAKVGKDDNTSCNEKNSKVRPEGISSENGLIWTANEKESSISVVKSNI